MAGKFVITTAKNGEFTFNLKASNGEVILTASETYTSLSACENGINSVKKNVALSRIRPGTRSSLTRSTSFTRTRAASSASA